MYQDVRKRQHEFKNQLNALYSTHYTCATYEELVAAQKKYTYIIIFPVRILHVYYTDGIVHFKTHLPRKLHLIILTPVLKNGLKKVSALRIETVGMV